MGLAASQARFLAITARKADCEFRSMQIAQNKLSITRELQAATETYQNALNATMLVWDNQEYIDDPQPLSYGILMSPSIYNNYTPYVLTDRANRVIASKSIATAAQKAGIDPNGGNIGSEEGFRAFIAALGEEGILSNYTQSSFRNVLTARVVPKTVTINGNEKAVKYYNACIPVYVDEDMNYLATYYKDFNEQEINEKPENARDEIAYFISTDTYNNVNLYRYLSGKIKPTSDLYKKIQNGSVIANPVYDYPYDPYNGYGSEPMSKNELAGLTYSQLAEKMKGKFGDSSAKSKISGYFGTNFSNAYINGSVSDVKLEDILDNNVVLLLANNSNGLLGTEDSLFRSMLNDIKKNGLGEMDANYEKMWDMAIQMTESQFKNNSIKATVSSTDEIVMDASKYNSILNYTYERGNTKTPYYAVNLSNMFKTFFTMLTILEDGYKSNYSVDTLSAKSKYVTNDPSYRFQVDADGTETNENIMKLDFYMQLYNNLCINGYKIDERVSKDDEHLEQMLKNGSYFITSLGKDGHFYQSRYNDKEHTCIQVVDDEDAIAVAEAEYNYQKIRLTAKEDRLDLEMKNLDMEISALTTEYDSVKNLIAKSIEKTFKQFEG